MDFCASDDMSAEMTVQMKGTGARTTFYVSNLHMEGKVRVFMSAACARIVGWIVIW